MTVTAPRSSPSRRSTVAATAVADLRGQRPERLSGAGDDLEPDADAVVDHADADRAG